MAKDKDNEGEGVTGNSEIAERADEGCVLPAIVQEEIGRRLRATYGKLAAEPLPDKFVELLQQLSKPAPTEKPK
jgi:hypothetical protein